MILQPIAENFIIRYSKYMSMDSHVRFAVLVPLVKRSGEWHVLFEVRNANLKDHAGEISFPGGARERGERLEETAIRETVEELGICDEQIVILKELKGTLAAIRGQWISSFVGVISENATLLPSPDEVASVFTVPIDFLKQYNPELHLMSGRYGVPVKSYIYRYNGYKIWGITARLLKNFMYCLEVVEELLEERENP